jgi:hypothetical protein
LDLSKHCCKKNCLQRLPIVEARAFIHEYDALAIDSEKKKPAWILIRVDCFARPLAFQCVTAAGARVRLLGFQKRILRRRPASNT